MRKRFTAFVLAGVLAGLASGTPLARAASPTPKPKAGQSFVGAQSAILVDLSDGNHVLFHRADRIARAPASLTKIVTALVARDEYKLDEMVTMSPLVLKVYGSDLGLKPGMRMSVNDLLHALLMKSANDAAMALAGHDRFGYDHFVALMNQKARSLGAYDSAFKNPHGLDADGHVSSARDMAIFAREVLNDPVLAQIVRMRRYTIPWQDAKVHSVTFDNHNKLVLSNPNVIGVKTGFTAHAGNCLITAERTAEGTFLTVVMNTPDTYRDTKTLMDLGKQIELRGTSGGGSFDSVARLPDPPQPPVDGFATTHAGVRSKDPRDDMRWAVVMMVLAALTLLSFAIRRRPATQGAEVHEWLDALAREPVRR